ncbi:MAG: zinc ABC transporter substrate-binding protein [Cyanobacteriota bacterium]|nr:zinc ABC transporter substrate-binding protein [Cyanobacteriota bacterium]
MTCGVGFRVRAACRTFASFRGRSCLGALVTLGALLSSCGSLSSRVRTTSPVAGQPLRVMATFLPMALLTRAVAGDCAKVTVLVPPSLAPHDFQAKPGNLLALRRSRVLVKNGLGMEGFLEKLIAAAAPPQLLVIDSSRGVATIGAPPKRDHPTDHDHGHDHDHGAVNPHIWLDPLRAAQQVETIRDGLVKADPGCAQGYGQRAASTTAQLRQLHREFTRQLQPFRGKTFVAFHDVAPYFAERYGLKAVFLVDVPELNPTPGDLQRVSQAVKRSDLKALLSEPQEGERSFHALAADLGVPISVFDPLETGSEEAARDPGTYARVMRRNVANLIQAFGGR